MLSWLLTADRSLSPPSALASGRRDSAWVHCRRSCGSRARTCSRRACRQCRRFHSPASRSVESSRPEASANPPSSTPRQRPGRPSVSASLGQVAESPGWPATPAFSPPGPRHHAHADRRQHGDARPGGDAHGATVRALRVGAAARVAPRARPRAACASRRVQPSLALALGLALALVLVLVLVLVLALALALALALSPTPPGESNPP